MTMEAKIRRTFSCSTCPHGRQGTFGYLYTSRNNIKSCTGCRLNYPSQKDDEDCMWLEWPDRVDKYFDKAIIKLTEERYYVRFVNMLYIENEMFEEELDACVKEATHFVHTN